MGWSCYYSCCTMSWYKGKRQLRDWYTTAQTNSKERYKNNSKFYEDVQWIHEKDNNIMSYTSMCEHHWGTVIIIYQNFYQERILNSCPVLMIIIIIMMTFTALAIIYPFYDVQRQLGWVKFYPPKFSFKISLLKLISWCILHQICINNIIIMSGCSYMHICIIPSGINFKLLLPAGCIPPRWPDGHRMDTDHNQIWHWKNQESDSIPANEPISTLLVPQHSSCSSALMLSSITCNSSLTELDAGSCDGLEVNLLLFALGA